MTCSSAVRDTVPSSGVSVNAKTKFVAAMSRYFSDIVSVLSEKNKNCLALSLSDVNAKKKFVADVKVLPPTPQKSSIH